MNNPTTLAVVIIALSCAAASIILAVRSSRRKSAWRELNNAARKLVKEQNLGEALVEGKSRRGRIRVIIALSWKDRQKEAFVFDPADGVRIGRKPDLNNVAIPDNEVSLRHCVLYRSADGRDIILEDLGSTNGTIIFHGLRRMRVRKNRIRVYDGDRLQVGGVQLQLNIFRIDSAYI